MSSLMILDRPIPLTYNEEAHLNQSTHTIKGRPLGGLCIGRCGRHGGAPPPDRVGRVDAAGVFDSRGSYVSIDSDMYTRVRIRWFFFVFDNTIPISRKWHVCD